MTRCNDPSDSSPVKSLKYLGSLLKSNFDFFSSTVTHAISPPSSPLKLITIVNLHCPLLDQNIKLYSAILAQ